MKYFILLILLTSCISTTSFIDTDDLYNMSQSRITTNSYLYPWRYQYWNDYYPRYMQSQPNIIIINPPTYSYGKRPDRGKETKPSPSIRGGRSEIRK